MVTVVEDDRLLRVMLRQGLLATDTEQSFDLAHDILFNPCSMSLIKSVALSQGKL